MSDLVTRRPGRGSAYARDTSYTNDHWNKVTEPGGRKLWIKLVLGFTVLAVFGTALLALGAILFEHAYSFHEDGNTALPMALCVISIVCGLLMFFGSIILGKLVISNKWRKNQQPSYTRRSAATTRVRYTIPRDENTPAQVEIDLPPPPYDSDGQLGPLPSIYLVSGNLHISNMPPPPDLMLNPPEYTEVSVKPPSYSTISQQAPVHTAGDRSENPMPNEEVRGAASNTNHSNRTPTE